MDHLVTEFHIKMEMISYQHELKRDISAIIKGKFYLSEFRLTWHLHHLQNTVRTG